MIYYHREMVEPYKYINNADKLKHLLTIKYEWELYKTFMRCTNCPAGMKFQSHSSHQTADARIGYNHIVNKPT